MKGTSSKEDLLDSDEAQMYTQSWEQVKVSQHLEAEKEKALAYCMGDRHHSAAGAVEQGNAENHGRREPRGRGIHEPHAREDQATAETFQMGQSFWNSLVGESLKKKCLIKSGAKTHESVNRDSICIPNSV